MFHVAILSASSILSLLMRLYCCIYVWSTSCKIIIGRRYFRINLICLLCRILSYVCSVARCGNRHVFKPLRLLNHRPLTYNVVVLCIDVHSIYRLSLLWIRRSRVMCLTIDLVIRTISFVAASALATKTSFIAPICIETRLIITLWILI